MNFLKRIKKVVQWFVYGHRATSERYKDFLIKRGAEIGDNFIIFCPNLTIIDTQNAYMLKIGNNVSLTGPVTILTHDYSWKVYKDMDGRILGNQQPVIIGNNVFIGWGATILAGTVIEDNVIIGAGSVVSGHCEANSVYAGVPAKRIMSIEELIERREKRQLTEAKQMQRFYLEKYGKQPDIRLFESYFPLFTSSKNFEEMISIFDDRLSLENNKDVSIHYLKENNKNIFNTFEEFLNSNP
ncbi:acyltransferase [Butyrivibrio sp. MC2021]|uniref:acyltransferase n=1 Tax=Butyrivibrio sp. MC2021 TaxID=1408306 RepID=UPI000A53F96B|nr:acyltransferase [Butyrivibrio sp. MC2021]